VLKSVLIANRGEIACRIMRTAKRLGMRTIAVYSEADAAALHVKSADEAHLIGPAPARESYLKADKILNVALAAGADCIHPGYGFLSENADFAESCSAAGIVFVGPPAQAIRAMGLKDAAKALVEKANVPVVPGYHGSRQESDFLRGEADKIGYPVLIKAVAGGGGKGMRRVDASDAFADELAGAQREAAGAFGDARVLIEKYVTAPRHVEVQVFADGFGNVVHLFERDCSLQRRHQKVIEEAPAPGMSAETRAAMGRAAVEAARAVGYVGAGTVEFIADASQGLRPDGFYFMEMNTRLQVEHPVTEAITGLDLVELQFRVASGEKLPFVQQDLSISGHAVEARLYAEDPEKGFLPSTGRLHALRLPEPSEGLRIDTGVEEGDIVTPFYDPMIAKIIAHGATRDAALDRLAEALEASIIAGPKTNAAFLARLCQSEDFRRNAFDTGFIDRHLSELGAVEQPADPDAICAGALEMLRGEFERLGTLSDDAASPWSATDGFQCGPARRNGFLVLADGVRQEVILTFPHGEGSNGVLKPVEAHVADREQILRPEGDRGMVVVPAVDDVLVLRGGRQTRISAFDPLDVDLAELEQSDGAIKAPMHGKLIALFVKVGETVKKGQKLAIVEAMKMEHALLAGRDGEIAEIFAEIDTQVSEGARILSLTNPVE
jgi:3-methylcrotonyl-CoA carboxylase alpha subunit